MICGTIHKDIDQGTPEWHALRCGKVTASRLGAVMAKGRNGAPSATRATYMGELIAERLSGVQQDGFVSAAMQRGKDVEPEARAAYAFYASVDLETVAFVDHPTIAMAGCSPDTLAGTNGLVEIKCPNSSTHIDTLLGAAIDRDYLLQMSWQMSCTGRAWCDFVSYDNRLPEHMRLHVRRVVRDDVLIGQIETEVRAFIAELEAKVAALHAKFPEAA